MNIHRNHKLKKPVKLNKSYIFNYNIFYKHTNGSIQFFDVKILKHDA